MLNTVHKHTIPSIDQQSARPSEVHLVSEFHGVQMLGHLPSLGEAGVGVPVVHL